MAFAIAALAARGWRTYHTHDSRRSAAGFPDLIAVRAGRILAIECKSATGKLTAAQREWMLELDAVPGVEAFVLRPERGDGERLTELLEREYRALRRRG
jgi:hypothetical protein